MGSEANEETALDVANRNLDKTADLVAWLIGVLTNAIGERKQLKESLQTAEQRAAETEARCKNACAELEKISTGTHPLYVMRADAQVIQPGDVVYRKTGEHRVPRDGDCIDDEDGGFLVVRSNNCEEPDAIYRRIDAPSGETANPSPAPAAESGKWAVEAAKVRPNGRLEFVVYRQGRELTQGDADDAAEWLENRAEIESQLAQLAKYKRDAEAWEKDHRAMEAMERHSMSVVQCYPDWRACVMGRDHEGVIRASHLDAVLALAASLSQQTGGKE